MLRLETEMARLHFCDDTANHVIFMQKGCRANKVANITTSLFLSHHITFLPEWVCNPKYNNFTGLTFHLK